MPVVTATRFRVSKGRYLPRFLKGSIDAARQARQSPGFLGGKLRAEPVGGAYWTLTVWQSGRDMVAFRDSGVHAVLMPKLAKWASEAIFGVWASETSELPGWDAVCRRVAEHPNFAALEHPTAAHLAQRFDPTSRLGFDLPIPRPGRIARVGSRT